MIVAHTDVLSRRITYQLTSTLTSQLQVGLVDQKVKDFVERDPQNCTLKYKSTTQLNS